MTLRDCARPVYSVKLFCSAGPTKQTPTGNTADPTKGQPSPLDGMNGDIYGQDVNGVPRPYSPTGLPVPPRTPTSDPQEWITATISRWHEVSDQRRNQVFWGAIIIFASGLVLTFLFWQDIQEFLGHQTATVTQMTLDDKELKFKVEEFAKALVNELLEHYTKDEQTRTVTVEFLTKIITDPATTKATVQLANSVLVDENFKSQTVSLAQYIVGVVLSDQHTTDQVVVLLKKVAAMEETQNLLIWLFTTVFNDPTIQTELQKLAVSVLSQQYVQDKVNDVSHTAAITTLNDPTVIETAQKFVNSTLTDNAVQEAAGYAIWEAFVIALTPSVFRRRQHDESQEDEAKQNVSEKTPELVEPLKEDEGRISVPDEYLERAAEILFRQAYERSLQMTDESLSFTPESLNVKKRMLDIELKNTKQKLAPKLKKKFQEISDEKFATVFQIDKAIIELGGENALIVRAKTMTEKQIALYENYLESMKKANKGWIYDSYTPAQLEDRKKIQQIIKELEEESHSKEKCLEKALKSMGIDNPVQSLAQGTIEELLTEVKVGK